MTKNATPRGKDVWIVICEEYLVLKETKKDLTIKGFCNMRDSVNYNTARVRMPKILKEINDRSKQDQRKILPDGTKAREHSGKTHSEYLARPEASKTKGHSIYSKYFDPELLDLAAQGTLDDDLLLYRSKALEALDYMVKLRDEIDNAAAASAKEPNNETLEKKVKGLEARLANSDKALSWCITRIENIAMTIKKIELTSVMIVKERANVVKTKAMTKATLHQSNKYKADTKLAKAKAYELEHGSKGEEIDEIVKEIQKRRDLLPSMTKREDQ